MEKMPLDCPLSCVDPALTEYQAKKVLIWSHLDATS